jgi:hypothetical protein
MSVRVYSAVNLHFINSFTLVSWRIKVMVDFNVSAILNAGNPSPSRDLLIFLKMCFDMCHRRLFRRSLLLWSPSVHHSQRDITFCRDHPSNSVSSSLSSCIKSWISLAQVPGLIQPISPQDVRESLRLIYFRNQLSVKTPND